MRNIADEVAMPNLLKDDMGSFQNMVLFLVKMWKLITNTNDKKTAVKNPATEIPTYFSITIIRLNIVPKKGAGMLIMYAML
jgi:hypothetical protein